MEEKRISMRGKNVLGLADFSAEEIRLVLDTAREMKNIIHRDIKKVPTLRGKSIVTLFYEPSTRTRTSFELAGKYLGADVVNINGDCLQVSHKGRLKRCHVKTLPYPGFPTDLQQPMAVLMSIAEGNSRLHESIFENRFKYVDELRKMGAHISINGRTAMIEGVPELSGTKIAATDLRAGAAMVIAALVAKGRSEITGLKFIDRGYENLEENFRNLGAHIERVTVKSHLDN